MWQLLLRNWLLGQARQKMREAAEQATSGAAAQAAHASAEHPPGEPPVCHVGLVFALGIEAGGLIDRLAGVIRIDGAGFVAREGGLAGRRLVVIESGVGAKAAAKSTDALIFGHRPRWVISAGFAGGLDPRLAQGDMLLADRVVDLSGRSLDIDLKLDRAAVQSQRGVHVGSLLTVDRIIHDASEKRALGQRFGALAVDMETAAVAEVCRREKVRFMAVRVISDAVDHSLPKDINHLVQAKTTAGRLGAAAGAILRRPSSVKDMWQLKEDALIASDRLAKFLTGVIQQLP